jgi:hypothetical protein
VGAIDGQFVGQMLGWDALSDATQDLDNRRTAIAGFPEDCASEEVEDGATLAAAIVRNDWPPPAVGRLISGKRVTARTVQAIWMQNVQQEVITRQFIEQAVKRKSQHRVASFATGVSGARAARGRPPISFTSRPT